MTLLMLVLSLLFLASTAEELDSLEEVQRDVRIVHYQPEQVHLSFGGM